MWPILLLGFLCMYMSHAIIGTPQRILSCNIRGLPFVNGWGYHGRLGAFINEQKSFYDTIVLQEVFMPGVRNTVRAALEPEFNTIYRSNLFAGNGLMIASRYDIGQVETTTFESCSGTDCLTEKGAMGARIGDLFLVVTHLQDAAWDESGRVRRDQLENIKRLCANRNSSILVVGDFNTPPASPLLRSLGMEVVSSGHPTHDSGVELDYAMATGPYQWRCLLLQDTPPADHQGIVLERDERDTSYLASEEDARTSNVVPLGPAPSGTCERA